MAIEKKLSWESEQRHLHFQIVLGGYSLRDLQAVHTNTRLPPAHVELLLRIYETG